MSQWREVAGAARRVRRAVVGPFVLEAEPHRYVIHGPRWGGAGAVRSIDEAEACAIRALREHLENASAVRVGAYRVDAILDALDALERAIG